MEKEGGQHDGISPLQTPEDKSGFFPFQSGLVVANGEILSWTPDVRGQRHLDAGVKRCHSCWLVWVLSSTLFIGDFLWIGKAAETPEITHHDKRKTTLCLWFRSILSCDIYSLSYRQLLILFPSQWPQVYFPGTKSRGLLRKTNSHLFPLQMPFLALPSPWSCHWIVLVLNVDGVRTVVLSPI